MKTAGPGKDTTVLSTDTEITNLPGSAQQQIEALRAAIDVRLAALETVLADPTRDDSLERLIVDLARLATEEAQAVATRACFGIKLEADTEIAQARKSAQQAIEHERIVSSDFRRSLEQAQQRAATLEREKESELRALRDQFEAKAASERTAVDAIEREAATLERTLGETRQQLEAAHAAADGLREEIGRGEARIAAASREQAEARAAVAKAETAAEQERQRAAQTAQAHAATQADLATERAASAELRGAIERTRSEAATLERDREEVRKLQASIEGEVARERQIAADLERRVRDTEKLLGAERTAAAELKKAMARAEEQGAALTREHGEAQASLKTAATSLERERQKVADLGRAREGLTTQIETERSLARELRATIGQLEQQLARASEDSAMNVAGQDELRDAVRSARAGAQTLQNDLEAECRASQQLRARLDELESRALRADKDSSDQDEVKRALQAAKDENQTLTTALDAEKRAAADLRGRLDQLGHQLAQASSQTTDQGELKQTLSAAQGQIHALRTELESERAGLRELQEQAERLRGQAARNTERASGSSEDLLRSLQTAEEQSRKLDLELDAERRAGEKLQRRIDDLEERLSRLTDETLESSAGSDELRRAVLSARADMQGVRTELTAERSRAADLDERLQRATEELSTAMVTISSEREAHTKLEETLAASLTEHTKLLSALEAATNERDRLHTDLAIAKQPAPHKPHKAAHAKAPAPRPPAPRELEPPLAAISASQMNTGKVTTASQVTTAKTTTAVALSESEWTAVRMSTRYQFKEKVEIQVNAASGWLYDISAGGCQLLSRGAVKPKQALKITLPMGDRGVLCTGKVIWARLEPPTAGQPLSYRAGVQFTNPDENAIEAFLRTHGVEL